MAHQNNEYASDAARQQFDAKAAPHNFSPQQLVLVDEHSFLNKNQKLAPKWSGPHRVIRLKGDANVEIQLKHNNRKTVVHANRLKPYFVASKNVPVCPDFLHQPPPLQTFPDDVHPPLAGGLFTCPANFVTRLLQTRCTSTTYPCTYTRANSGAHTSPQTIFFIFFVAIFFSCTHANELR